MPYKDKDRQKQYQREWMRARRAEFFVDKECKKCKSKDDLEIHHRNPAKKVSHVVWSWSSDRRYEELRKCDVLCCKCHKERTAEQLGVEWQHGTPYGYRTHGCRCGACREAHRIYMRKYLSRR